MTFYWVCRCWVYTVFLTFNIMCHSNGTHKVEESYKYIYTRTI